jgi:cold shock CspA family protein
MTQNRELGTVLSWEAAEGRGQIQADAGDILWAHSTFIVQTTGFRGLTAGQRVEFTRIEAGFAPPEERPQAWDVVALPPSESR